MSFVVQKFGGSSLANQSRIKFVAQHIKETIRQGEKIVVVVSAMGDHTNQLYKSAFELHQEPPKRELDMLLSVGERITMSLLSISLDAIGVRATSLTGSQSGILTDSSHGNARIIKILGDRIYDGLKRNDVVIVAGFQGVHRESREITTLGRGGSDLTAVALCAALKAENCHIYTDVPGVLSADPRLVRSAIPLRHISWRTASEMAWHGAKVIHHRAAHLAEKYHIPVTVRSSIDLSAPGTLIEGQDQMESTSIEAITHVDHLKLVQFHSDRQSSQTLSLCLDWLWQQGESPLIARQASSNQGNIIELLIDEKHTTPLKDWLEDDQSVEVRGWQSSEPMSLVSIIGSGFRQSPETLQEILRLTPYTPILIETKDHSIHLGMSGDKAEEVLTNLHRALIN